MGKTIYNKEFLEKSKSQREKEIPNQIKQIMQMKRSFVFAFGTDKEFDECIKITDVNGIKAIGILLQGKSCTFINQMGEIEIESWVKTTIKEQMKSAEGDMEHEQKKD